MFRDEGRRAVLERFPLDVARPDFSYGKAERQMGTPGVVGTYVDAWGCVWRVSEPGVAGEVKGPPLADWAVLDRFRPPDEILDRADLSRVGTSYAATEKFVVAGTTVRPFERMQFLRGTENLLMDLAWGTREVYRLRDIVHEFFLRELEMWAGLDVDAISFMDDWGSQSDLLISPKLWREFFKPLYADYCRIIRDGCKFVHFHSDGHIARIIPELIELGVQSLNCQVSCMDIEEIGRQFKGKIAFWGELDRQSVLPQGTVADVRAAVRRLRAALEDERGGLIAGLSWGNDVPRRNIEAAFEAWEEPFR
jgi:hypothetical protein